MCVCGGGRGRGREEKKNQTSGRDYAQIKW